MTKSYEELSGAQGRAQFFRPTRQEANAVFSGSPPIVYFDDQEYGLKDLSGVGIGCDADPVSGVDAVNRQGVLRLVQRGKEIYRAKARQARFDVSQGRATAGFALEDSIIDLDQLRVANARAIMAAPVVLGDAIEVPTGYRAICADVLEFTGRLLDGLDKHVRPLESKLSYDETVQFVSETVAAIRPQWRSLLEEANTIVRPFHDDKKLRAELKRYTERTVTRALVGGSSWARSYYKPAGYPGDYKIMNFMYDQTPVGADAREMLLHALGVCAGEPIVSRMRKLSELIVEFGEKDGLADDAIDIMSIGCGPARELEGIANLSSGGRKWRATLIDQEPEAIEYAIASARRKGLTRTIDIEPLNLSFVDMLARSPVSPHFADKDVIYSSGLVDYLTPISAMRFVKRMYDFLRPGGRLIIGNVNDLTTGTLWPMEYVLDWTLYFRSHDEMTSMAAAVGDGNVRVESDELNAIYFLVVDKPA